MTALRDMKMDKDDYMISFGAKKPYIFLIKKLKQL